ncbi:MAG TPA: PxKF domain-containing protein [Pyrinomonadaceae bacterium]
MAFAVLVGLLALALYPHQGSATFRRAASTAAEAGSDSTSSPASVSTSAPGAGLNGAAGHSSDSPFSTAAAAPPAALFMQAGPEDVESFAADCVTPKTSFAAGETACAKATNLSGVLGFERVVYWISPEGTILQTDSVSTASPTATRVVGARGGWKLYLSTASDGSLRKASFFSVSDAANKAVDLSVYDAIDRRISSYAAGHSITYLVVVTNTGPDAATDVVLTETPANNATFDTVPPVQQSGPAFTCTRPSGSTCTLASMAAGETAEFAFVYTVDTGTAAGTEVNHSVTVTNDLEEEEELHEGDNESTATTNITGEVTAATCALNCPDDITVVANATQGGNPGAFVTFSSAEGLGDCGEISSNTPSGSFFPLGTTNVSVSSTEGAGACTFDVTVVTAGAPTVTCPGDVVVAAPAGESEATVNPGTPSTSPSSGVSVSGQRSDNELLNAPYPIGTTHITWTATDTSNGLSSTCTQKIIVTSDTCADDETDPAINAPPDVLLDTQAEQTGVCGLIVPESQLGTPDVSDNCVVNVARTGVPAGNFFPIGATTVTYTATDAAGNTATDTQIITIRDKTPPVIYAPANATYVCPSEVPAASASQAGGPLLDNTGQLVRDASGDLVPGGQPYDSCGAPTVGVTQTDNGGAGSVANPLVITRTYTATDSHGNTASASQTITVADGAAPTIALDGANPQVVECHTSYTELGATASDNCSANFAATPSGTVNVNVPGTYTITYNATDAAGNAATPVTRTVNVVDTTAPVMSCPADIVVYLPLNSTAVSMPVSFAPTATDSCDASVPVTTTIASGSIFNVGTTNVTASATDDAGNTSSCSFNVTVLYNFTGFFSPVDTVPTLNVVKAGSAIPVKFSLSGNKGLGIFAVGSPASGTIPCDAQAPLDPVEETVTAGGSSLNYDAASDRYSYIWKSEKEWANTCRQLVITLNDGSVHIANFKFTK